MYCRHCRSSRLRISSTVFVVVLLFNWLIFALVVDITSPKCTNVGDDDDDDGDVSVMVRATSSCSPSPVGDHALNTTNSSSAASSFGRQSAELAMVVSSVVDARDAATFLKTLVHHHRHRVGDGRHEVVRLHVVVTRFTHHIMRTLLDSWSQLAAHVDYQFYEANDSFVDSIGGKWSLVRFHLSTVLPSTVHKVLFVDVKMHILYTLHRFLCVLYRMMTLPMTLSDP